MGPKSIDSFCTYPPEIKYGYQRKEQYSLTNDIRDFASKKGADPAKIETYIKFWKGSVDAFVQFVIKCVKGSQNETCRTRISSSQIGYLFQGFFECAVRELYYIHEIKITHIDDLYKPKEILVEWPKDAPSKVDPSFQKAREKGNFIDYAFVAQDRAHRLNCHKLILCAKSSFFEKLLTGGFIESASHEIILPEGYPIHVVEVMLGFLYTGEIPLDALSKEEVMQLLTLSKYYDFQYLSQACADYLRTLIDEHTVEELAIFAHKFEIEDLKNGCQN